MKLENVLLGSLAALLLSKEALAFGSRMLQEAEMGETAAGGETGEAAGGRYIDRFFDENGNLKPEIQDLCNNWYITQNRENNSVDINTPPNAGETLSDITGGEPLPPLSQIGEELSGGVTVNGEALTGDYVRAAAEDLANALGANAEDANQFIDENQDQVADFIQGN